VNKNVFFCGGHMDYGKDFNLVIIQTGSKDSSGQGVMRENFKMIFD